MKFIILILLLTVIILYVRRFFYFIEKRDFTVSQALSAAAVAWVKDVPDLINNIVKGFKAGIDFIKGENIKD